LALGVLAASFIPGPGRRLRKQATKRGTIFAGVLAELAATYGSQFLEGAGKAARAGQDRLSDLGDTLGDSTRDLRSSAGNLAGDAGSSARDAGDRALRTFRNLRSRIAN
jgi:hypothetical protein